MVVTKGWKAWTDNNRAVYRGVKEVSVKDGVREYGFGRSRVYCHYPREVVRIPQHTEDRLVIFLNGSGLDGEPPKAGAATLRVKGVGEETESVVERMVYGLRPMERYKRWRTWFGVEGRKYGKCGWWWTRRRTWRRRYTRYGTG